MQIVNGSGEATVYVEPSLRTVLLKLLMITQQYFTTNTTTIMRLDTNELEWQTDNVSKYGISFSCSESLS
jgi:hypothetical protein